MNTEIRKITISTTENLNNRIKLECDEMGNISYLLATSFVLNDTLVLIFQKQD